MAASDKKYKIGLIGHPISHSQSPRLFRETFAERPDILSRYSYDLVEEVDFEAAYARFLADYLAVNVTAPFKTRAFEAADIHSEEARLCGAANLLVREPVSSVSSSGEWTENEKKCPFSKDGYIVKAYNTDCLAVKKILQDNGFRPGDTAYVYGCGGAGRAAVVAALLLGMRVRIYNRTITITEAFVQTLVSIHGEWTENIEICPLSSSLSGVWTEFSKKCPLSEEYIGRNAIVYTLPVSPTEIFRGKKLEQWQKSLKTTFVLEANYKDPHLSSIAPRYVSGLEWLRLQALATYEIVIR